MDCEEAAAVGAGSFFPVAVPKYDPQAAAGVHSLGKLVRASVKFAHAEACHLQDQSQFDGKRQASHFRSGIFFQSCLWGGTRAPGVADKIGVAIWGGPLPTFTVDRRVCQSLGCSSQGSKTSAMQLAAVSDVATKWLCTFDVS